VYYILATGIVETVIVLIIAATLR